MLRQRGRNWRAEGRNEGEQRDGSVTSNFESARANAREREWRWPSSRAVRRRCARMGPPAMLDIHGRTEACPRACVVQKGDKAIRWRRGRPRDKCGHVGCCRALCEPKRSWK